MVRAIWASVAEAAKSCPEWAAGPVKGDAQESAREIVERLSRPTPVVIANREAWPEAVSDGLTLKCSRCGRVPVVDFGVSDELWAEVVPPEWRLGVVCLDCFTALASPSRFGEELEIQWIGHGETVLFSRSRVYHYDARPVPPVEPEGGER